MVGKRQDAGGSPSRLLQRIPELEGSIGGRVTGAEIFVPAADFAEDRVVVSPKKIAPRVEFARPLKPGEDHKTSWLVVLGRRQLGPTPGMVVQMFGVVDGAHEVQSTDVAGIGLVLINPAVHPAAAGKFAVLVQVAEKNLQGAAAERHRVFGIGGGRGCSRFVLGEGKKGRRSNAGPLGQRSHGDPVGPVKMSPAGRFVGASDLPVVLRPDAPDGSLWVLRQGRGRLVAWPLELGNLMTDPAIRRQTLKDGREMPEGPLEPNKRAGYQPDSPPGSAEQAGH